MNNVDTPSRPKSPPPGLRGFLYLTAALNGAAILVIEILGAKMLAPYIGTSHFVWTAQISVTLLSLAIGYWLGGRWADRTAGLNRLFTGMIVAAAYLCLSLWITEPVSYKCLDMGIKLGSICAATFLFLIPLTLLAMTGPFLLKSLAESLTGVGGQAGSLSAVSTLGSVLGAGLIGYVLIPHLPNSTTLLVTAGVILALSVVYFVKFSRFGSGAVVALLLAAAGGGLGFKGVQADLRTDYGRGEELERANSPYGILQVIRIKGTEEYFYVNDYLTQNIYFKDTKQSGATFTYLLHGLARGYTTNLQSALCIGMGVGIVPSQLAREGVKCDVVEINDAIVPIAQRFFDLDTNSFQLHIGDGRHFLNSTKQRYDTVLLDAFLGDSSPSHLMTREAFAAMRKVLTPGGTLVLNCFGHLEGNKDFFMASLERTLQAVFKSVRIHNSGRGNVFMAASDRPDFDLVPPPDYNHVHASVKPDVIRSFVTLVNTDPTHGQVLTDDDNPVEYFDAANREQFRRNMALGMRRK